MNFNVIALIIACVLGATFASSNHKVEKVHSEVMSYVHKQMGNNTMMRRGESRGGSSLHLDCYNGFIPLINALASNAREVSNYCVNDANEEKDKNLSAMQIDRRTIEYEVAKITKSLDECSVQDGLNYFQCLADNAQKNKKLMEIIRDKSRDLMSEYAEKLTEIDQNEEDCLMNAIDMAKMASDKAFGDLKSCLKGGPAIEPFVDEESV